jgi:hypothetical protein
MRLCWSKTGAAKEDALESRSALSGKVAQQRRGAADRREHRHAEAFAEAVN